MCTAPQDTCWYNPGGSKRFGLGPPQHTSFSSNVMPQEWKCPDDNWMKVSSTGTLETAPIVSSPQQCAMPPNGALLCLNAHVWWWPAATVEPAGSRWKPGGGWFTLSKMLGTSSSSCSASGCKSLKTGSSCSLACFADELPKKGRLGASAAAAAARLLSWPSSWRRASPAEALPKKDIFDGAAGSAAAASLADEPPPKKESLEGAAGSASFELPKNESFDGAGSSAPKARRGSRGHHGLLMTVRGMLVGSALRFDICDVAALLSRRLA